MTKTAAIKDLMTRGLLSFPPHKIVHVITHETYVQGLWDTLNAYGVEHTKENHDLLVEVVQEKLEGPDLEREWSEKEYETFVKYKN
jgi:hypothetical protein